MTSAGRPGAWMFAPGTHMYAQTALRSPYSLFSYFTFSSSPSHPLATPPCMAKLSVIINFMPGINGSMPITSSVMFACALNILFLRAPFNGALQICHQHDNNASPDLFYQQILGQSCC